MERLTKVISCPDGTRIYDISNKIFGLNTSRADKTRMILEKLAAYEDLEELIGIPLNELAEIFRQHIPNGCKHPRKAIVLTDGDVDKWREYQMLEEQGRFIKLPCKIGDDVWFVPSHTNYKLNILNHHREENKICHQKVARITFSRNGWYMECDKDLEYATDHILIDKMYKETWFLTKSEAESRLEKLRGAE